MSISEIVSELRGTFQRLKIEEAMHKIIALIGERSEEELEKVIEVLAQKIIDVLLMNLNQPRELIYVLQGTTSLLLTKSPFFTAYFEEKSLFLEKKIYFGSFTFVFTVFLKE